jgi:hypothetical protein
MRKVSVIVLILAIIAFLVMTYISYGPKNEFQININVPAGTELEYVYSDEEIMPTKNTITMLTGQGLGDTSVVLKPVEPDGEEFCAVGYLTSGMTEKVKVKKGTWYKVGVKVSNPTDEDKMVGIIIKNIDVRIE